jgi:hypothetical protein
MGFVGAYFSGQVLVMMGAMLVGGFVVASMYHREL